MPRFLKKEDGAVLMLFALLMPVVLGCAAMVVDFGIQYGSKVRLQNIAQAAALAAAQDALQDPSLARDKAYEYLDLNGVQAHEAQVEISQPEGSARVTVTRESDYYFARILGFRTADISANAKAVSVGISSFTGAAPLGIMTEDFVYGQKYKLKYGSPPELGSGNFGALRLGGSGANNYEYNLKHGYPGELKVGDIVNIEPGNMSGPTKRAIEYRFAQDNRIPPNTFYDHDRDAPQILYVPVVEPYGVSGSHVHSVKILGFAAFFVTGIPGSGNESEIEGYFIRTVKSGGGSEGQANYGLTTSRLVNP
jgi:Flp pilus assembly protein TadG